MYCKTLLVFSLLFCSECIAQLPPGAASSCTCYSGYVISGSVCPDTSQVTCSLCVCPSNYYYYRGCLDLINYVSALQCLPCPKNSQVDTDVVLYQTGCKANVGYYGNVNGAITHITNLYNIDIYSSVPACGPGDYCVTTGLTQYTKSCPAGSYCATISTKTACTTGKYCPAGSTAEQPIPVGSCCPDPATKIDCVPGDYCLSNCVVYQKCIAGSYCPTLTSRLLCSPGKYCPEGSVAEQVCPEGSFCPNPSLNTSCILGNYCPAGSISNICPIGFYCPSFTQKIACNPGELCPANSPKATKCSLGFYCPDFVSSYACSASTYCPEGSFINNPCPAGSYCVNSSISVPCAPGQTCPQGTTAPSICPAGSLCSTPATQIPCPASSYCAAGSTQAVSCSTGQYCPTGTSTPSTCEAGYYCTNPSIRQACAAGQYCLAGSTIPTPCPKGSYCQSTSASPVPCPPNSFCADQVTTPTACTECVSGQKYITSECNATSNRQCATCLVCPSGQFETVVCQGMQNRQCGGCPVGYYCPTQFEKYLCPAGSTCAAGATAATPCPPNQTSFGGTSGCIDSNMMMTFNFDKRNGLYENGPDGSSPYNPPMDSNMGTVHISDGSLQINGNTIPRGIQVWTVGKTGNYMFIAGGAGSGLSIWQFSGSTYNRGPYGIVVYTKINLVSGDKICMVVGQTGRELFHKSGGLYFTSAPGGGSFITKYSGAGAFNDASQHLLILVAGGGGGGAFNLDNTVTYIHATTDTTGGWGTIVPGLRDFMGNLIRTSSNGGGGGFVMTNGISGGNGANGGNLDQDIWTSKDLLGICGIGAGGAGFKGNGGNSYQRFTSITQGALGGKSFLNGAAGGIWPGPCQCKFLNDNFACLNGSFGGGGAGGLQPAGGGGYSGGMGVGIYGTHTIGGSGGSYDHAGVNNVATQFTTWESKLGAQPPNFYSGYNALDGFIRVATCSPPYIYISNKCACSSGYYGGDVNSGGTCTPCAAGKYGLGVDLATEAIACSPCPANTNSIASSADINSCTANSGYAGSGNSVTICPANKYCPGSGISNPCPPNTKSPAASTQLTACTANLGYYGSPGTTPTLCPAGFSCGSGATTPTPCPLGTLCLSGSGSPSQCALGSYCPNTTVQITCSSGSYCTANSSVQSACPTGYFCTTPSTITICPASRFCPLSSTAGTLCSIGTFSNVTGLSACYACPPSTYASAQGATTCTACNTVTNPGTFRQGCGGSSAGTLVQCTN